MNLPRGWAEVMLSEIGQWGSGGTPKSGEPSYYGGDIPWIRSGDLPDGPIVRHELQITSLGLESSAAKWIEENAVLIAMYGATIGKLGVTTYPVTTNQAVAFVLPADGIEPYFVFQNLRARKDEWISLGQGGAQPNISQEILKSQKFALPPKAEQRRIVAKLDALTARIGRARAELDRVPLLTERYLKGVLSAAFNGELTKSWRETHKLTEPWRSIKWKDAGDTLNGRAYPSSEYSDAGVKLLRPGNMHQSGSVVWTASNTRFLPVEWSMRHPKHHIIGSEIVINLTAQSLDDEFLARTCLSAADDEFLLNQRLAVFRPNCMSKMYCLFALKSPKFRSFVDGGLNSGSLIQHVHTKQLEQFIFNVAPEAEQDEIVRQLVSAFARADRLEAEAARARKLLDRLESAILAKAFRGELVPQDENDEPAEKLLERIRAERAAAPKAKRGRKSRA